jgi:lysophospholipase L1-like esterase
LLAAASAILTLALAEIGARIWVATQWTESHRIYFTEGFEIRDGYATDPVLGFRPAPYTRMRNAWGIEFRHNSLGFRGPEIRAKKAPGTLRVVTMGASTVYGFFVAEEETSAARLERILARRLPGFRVEVVNAGVPGWTSRESLLSLEPRVLSLEPDVVLLMDGRNEVFPQLYNGYRDDYSHYRRLGFDFRTLNASWRRLFRLSHLAMILTTRGVGRFGFSLRDEHPIYGYVRYENQPDLEDIRRNAREAGRERGFRRNLESFVETTRARGAVPVLVSVPFWPEKWEATGILEKDEAIVPYVTEAVIRNNAIVREVARVTSTAFVDSTPISRAEYLYDDCHLNPEGEQILAAMMDRAIGPLLAQRIRGG